MDQVEVKMSRKVIYRGTPRVHLVKDPEGTVDLEGLVEIHAVQELPGFIRHGVLKAQLVVDPEIQEGLVENQIIQEGLVVPGVTYRGIPKAQPVVDPVT